MPYSEKNHFLIDNRVAKSPGYIVSVPRACKQILILKFIRDGGLALKRVKIFLKTCQNFKFKIKAAMCTNQITDNMDVKHNWVILR